MSRGVLSLVEAAYAVDLPHRDWALGLLKATEEIVNGGIGGFACAFEVPNDGPITIDRESAVSLGVPAEMVTTIFAGLSAAPHAWFRRKLRSLRGPANLVLTSQFDADENLAYRSRLNADGVDDGVNLLARDLEDYGFLPLPRGHRRPAFSERQRAREVNRVIPA